MKTLKLTVAITAFTVVFAFRTLLCFGQPPQENVGAIPYDHMPEIAPIGVQIGKYFDVPASAQGPAIKAGKGYRLQELGKGLYMITDNAYQSMFMVYEAGVVLIDAPPPFAKYIRKAV